MHKPVGIPSVTFRLHRFEVKNMYANTLKRWFGGVGLPKDSQAFDDGDIDTSRDCIRIPAEQFNALVSNNPCRFDGEIKVASVSQVTYLANVQPTGQSIFDEVRMMLTTKPLRVDTENTEE